MFPDKYSTRRLTFRPIAPDDAGAIFETYAQDPAVTRFLTWRPHASPADTQAYIAHCLSASPQLARTYVLIGREDAAGETGRQAASVICGAIGLRLAGPHRLEFGYVLARACWGNGLMTEALQQVVLWAMAQPPIFRISSVCDTENPASARVMEKAGLERAGLERAGLERAGLERAGLEREGTLRRWLVHPNISDQPRDCYAYALAR